MPFQKSITTTWRLFASSRKNAIVPRILLIITPFILAFGVSLSVATVLSFPLVVTAFILTLLISAGAMLYSTKEQTESIERLLSDVSTESLPKPLPTPEFYQGAGAWIGLGHIPKEQFITIVRTLDAFFDNIPHDQDLSDLIEYRYVMNTFAPRHNQNALYLVEEDTPGAYPVTILAGRYDYYIPESKSFPQTGPILAPPFTFKGRSGTLDA